MDKGIIKITMFGSLRIEYDGKTYAESGTRVNKPLELLVLLLIGRGTPLSNEQLIERLWNEDEALNPAGALKNAAYSLRKTLSAINSQQEYILTEGGMYRWNDKIPVSFDVWSFEDIQTQLFDEEHRPAAKKQIELLRAAINLYAGDFLPAMSSRHWVIQQANYLRQLYISNVLSLSALLLQSAGREKLEEVINLCNRAILAESLNEELYLCLFTAMRRLGMKTAINNYYPVVSNLFFDQLGVSLPAPIREIYLWASEGYNSTHSDIRQIQQDLDELTRDARPIRGAYYCQYEVFKHMFHMIVRNATRTKNVVVLMLITVTDERGGIVAKEHLILSMLKLKQLIKDALRKGDVYSRYSRNQYIIMLTVSKIEDCEIVNKRIKHDFSLQSPPKGTCINILTGKPVKIT